MLETEWKEEGPRQGERGRRSSPAQGVRAWASEVIHTGRLPGAGCQNPSGRHLTPKRWVELPCRRAIWGTALMQEQDMKGEYLGDSPCRGWGRGLIK